MLHSNQYLKCKLQQLNMKLRLCHKTLIITKIRLYNILLKYVEIKRIKYTI